MIRNYAARARQSVVFIRRPDRVTWLLVALSLLGAGLVLARTVNYGAGQGWDTINYIGVARNLLDGDGLVNVLGVDDYHTATAPLYPVALAAAGLGIFDPYDVVAPLNAAIFGFTVFAMGQYFRRRVKSRFVFWWGCAAVALSIPLIWLASFALAGSLFILLTVLALIQCDYYLEEGKTSALIWAAVFSALAWQTRYVGLAAPAAIALMLLFQRGATGPERARRVSVYSLLAAAPMGLWLLRNYLRIGEIIGVTVAVDYTLADVWDDLAAIAAAGWGKLYLPSIEGISDGSALSWTALIVMALAVVVMAPLAYIFIKEIWQYRNNMEGRSIIIFGVFALIYVVLVIAGAVTGGTWHGIQSRYLIPLYLPLLAMAALVLDQFISYSRDGGAVAGVARLPVVRYYARLRVKGMPLAAVVLIAGLGFLVAAMFIANVREIDRVNSVGLSHYSNDVWVNSGTLRYIRENPLSGNIYSNAPMLTYIYTDGEATYWLLPYSRPGGYVVDNRENDGSVDGRERLREWVDDAPDGAYLVWFLGWTNNELYDYTAADMRLSPELELTAELDDGVIFRVARGTTPPP